MMMMNKEEKDISAAAQTLAVFRWLQDTGQCIFCAAPWETIHEMRSRSDLEGLAVHVAKAHTK